MISDFQTYYQMFQEDTNYIEIQEIINRAVGTEDVFRFDRFITDVVSGKMALNIDTLWEVLKTTAFGQINTGASDLVKIMTIAIIAAIFTNFSFTFKGSHVSETAFYVTYVSLYGILTATYFTAYRLTFETLLNITEFMKIMVPSYCIAIVFGTGTVTSIYWYEVTLGLITLAEFILLKIALPIINIYMMASLASNLSKEDSLSKFTELLESIIRWGMRSMMAVMIGINTIQGMITPAIDQWKRNSVIKTASGLPGVGNLINGVSETMLGAGILLKNAFGAAGMISLFVICLIPIASLTFYALLYKAGAALIQPVSEKRIINCMNAASVASGLLTKTVFYASLLFIISIAMVSFTMR